MSKQKKLTHEILAREIDKRITILDTLRISYETEIAKAAKLAQELPDIEVALAELRSELLRFTKKDAED